MTASAQPLILAFGDSLTAGYGLTREEAFPAQLELLLRETAPAASVYNAGVSGDTTADALRRLPTVLSALTQRPDLAIVELGANDLIRRVNPAQTAANLDAIVREIARCGIPVLLASFALPAFLGPAAGAYAGIYDSVAKRHGVPVHPFFPPGIMGHHAHVLSDRLHPNAGAIRTVALAMVPVIRALLDDT